MSLAQRQGGRRSRPQVARSEPEASEDQKMGSEPKASEGGLLHWLASWLRREPAGAIRVRVVVKGRIGEGWFDVDRKIALPAGATLAALIDAADRAGLRLSQAIEASPHLRHTLMWNGERTPVDENLGRELRDGDELYLLGPVAGG